MSDSAPRNIRDIKETIHATEVEECTKIRDIFNRTFQYLTFLQATDDVFALFSEVTFDKSFVRNHSVFDCLIDFDNLELHDFINVLIVINHWLDVNLRTW